jgi:hypothetical protein
MITPSIILMLLVGGLAIGFVAGTVAALRRGDGWHWLASLPFLCVIAVVARIVVDVSVDPTAHNLWPFEVLGALVIACVALGVVQLLRLLSRRWGGRPDAPASDAPRQ